jgi:hypothetical protein
MFSLVQIITKNSHLYLGVGLTPRENQYWSICCNRIKKIQDSWLGTYMFTLCNTGADVLAWTEVLNSTFSVAVMFSLKKEIGEHQRSKYSDPLAFFFSFYMDIAYVSSRYCICCNGYTSMLQICFPNVSAVSSECYICCNGYTRMLQVYVPNVSPI